LFSTAFEIIDESLFINISNETHNRSDFNAGKKIRCPRHPMSGYCSNIISQDPCARHLKYQFSEGNLLQFSITKIHPLRFNLKGKQFRNFKPLCDMLKA